MPPEEAVRWPLLAGGIAVTGMLGTGVLLQFDATLQILQPTAEGLRQDEDSEGEVELGVGNLATMCIGYVVAALPVDDLKMRLLRGGALTYWSIVTGLGERGHELISLNSMNDLLSGDSGLRLFHTDPEAYALLVDSLLSTLKPQDVLGSRVSLDEKGRGRDHVPEILALGSTLASHPSFRGARGDERFWVALLEGGEASLDEKPELAPAWASIAFACAERPRLARRILFDVNVKRRLLQLTEESEEVVGLQRGYAAAALHRLALAAAAEEGAPVVSLGLRGRLLEEFLDRPPLSDTPLPVRPMADRSQDDLGPASRLALAAIGGFAWALARCFRKAVRTSKPIRLTLLSTAVGATAFQAFQEADLLMHKHVWLSAFGSVNSPNFTSISSFSAVTAGEFAVSFGLLWALVQPGRAPFAFGGWIVGQVLGIDLD